MTEGLDVLAARVDALKELSDERDKRYEERHVADQDAVKAALAAAKEAVSAALASSEKAAEKFSDALAEYKKGANEWRDTVKDLIGNLRESRSSGTGKEGAEERARARDVWYVGLVISAITIALHFWK